jgi:plasmid stabilization system protein ParE
VTRRVILRPRAELDVDDFFFYLAIERDNPGAANRFLDALEAACNRLAEHPEIGAKQDVENPRLAGVRTWAVPSFQDRMLYYIAHDEIIDVIRVLGRPQDRESIFKDEQ